MWVPEDGALSCENWQAALAGAPGLDGFEYPVFSDAELSGEITSGFGPYKLIDSGGGGTHQPSVPAAYLRLHYHLHFPLLDMSTTQAQRYHGGYIQDELVALLSLCIGIRLKAGGATRHFQRDGDPRGRPWSFKQYGQADPVFVPSTHGIVLPAATGQHTVALPIILARFPELSQPETVVIIRAARLYQEAVWIAESTPALSWIFLVSAIETAAGYWRNRRESPVERMLTSRPEIQAILEEAGGEELVLRVAEMMAPYMGATKTFLDFLEAFVPHPPSPRPPEFAQHSWAWPDLKKSLRTIYSLRSQALHGGTPFPAPMCLPARPSGEAYDEKPVGTAAGAFGAVWVANDIPMLLHTFSYLVQGALLNWWETLLRTPDATERESRA